MIILLCWQEQRNNGQKNRILHKLMWRMALFFCAFSEVRFSYCSHSGCRAGGWPDWHTDMWSAAGGWDDGQFQNRHSEQQLQQHNSLQLGEGQGAGQRTPHQAPCAPLSHPHRAAEAKPAPSSPSADSCQVWWASPNVSFGQPSQDQWHAAAEWGPAHGAWPHPQWRYVLHSQCQPGEGRDTAPGAQDWERAVCSAGSQGAGTVQWKGAVPRLLPRLWRSI